MTQQRALILDDDRAKADLVGSWLEQYGISSDRAYSYQEAMGRLYVNYDFVISDYFLKDVKTGLDFINEYQKRHSGSQIYLYTSYPEKIEGCSPIVFSELEKYFNNKFKIKVPEKKEDTKERKMSEFFYVKNNLDKEISDLKTIVARHDEKIKTQEKIQEELKRGINALNTMVTDFISMHSNDSKKIIFWVSGVIFTLLTIFVAIEWAIIEHLVGKLLK